MTGKDWRRAVGRLLWTGTAVSTVVAISGLVFIAISTFGTSAFDDIVDLVEVLSFGAVLLGGLLASLRRLLEPAQTVATVEQRLYRVVEAETREERGILLGLDEPVSEVARTEFAETGLWDEFSDLSPELALGVDGLPDRNSPPVNSIEDVADFFLRGESRQLVILGRAGAGKTVLAVELMCKLMTRRRHEITLPLPIKFSMANWLVEREGLDEWLLRELNGRYNVPIHLGRSLLLDRRILPVLDGLDEMDSSDSDLINAERAARLIHSYVVKTDIKLVLTSRTQCYRYMASRIKGALEVELLPLTAVAIVRYIARVSNTHDEQTSWRPVIRSLCEPENGVIRTLDTPWKMTMAVTFQKDGGDPSELIPQQGETPESAEVRTSILLTDRFVSAKTRIARVRDYTPESAEAWARFLARCLDFQASQGGPRSEILTHFMSPIVRSQVVSMRWYALAMVPPMAITLLLALLAPFAGLASLVGWDTPLVLLQSLVVAVGTSLAVPCAATVAFIAATALVVTVPGPSRRVRADMRKARRGLKQTALHWFLLLLSACSAMLSCAVLAALLGLPFAVLAWFLTDLQTARWAALALTTYAYIPFTAATLGVAATNLSFREWIASLLVVQGDGGVLAAASVGELPRVVPGIGMMSDADAASGEATNWARASEEFLRWGVSAGIFKTSGIAFQFRHRELEDWWSLQSGDLLVADEAWLAELHLPLDIKDGYRQDWATIRAHNRESINSFRRWVGYGRRVAPLDVARHVHEARRVLTAWAASVVSDDLARAVMAARQRCGELGVPRVGFLFLTSALCREVSFSAPRPHVVQSLADSLDAVAAERARRLGLTMRTAAIRPRPGVLERDVRRVVSVPFTLVRSGASRQTKISALYVMKHILGDRRAAQVLRSALSEQEWQVLIGISEWPESGTAMTHS